MDGLTLIIIGLVAGLLGGLLGVGGSIVMLPALTEVLGPNQHTYQAAAMIVNFFVVMPAVLQHRRAGAIEVDTVRRIVPLALLGVLVGVGLSELPVFAGSGEAYLRVLLGMFLACVACLDLYRLMRRNQGTGALGVWTRDLIGPSDGKPTWGRVAMVAIPTGLIAGLLGVGGGLVAVPLQRRLLGIPIRAAIANSATIIIATSLVGATAKNLAFWAEHGSVGRPMLLAGLLIPTAMIGSTVGSHLTHRVPLRLIKSAFFLLLLVAAIRLVFSVGR